MAWLPGLVATGCINRSEINFYIWSGHCPLIHSVSQNQILGMESIYSIFFSLSDFICKIWLLVAFSGKALWDSLVAQTVKRLPTTQEDPGLIPGLGRSPTQRRKWQPTPVFLPGKSHGLRSLVGYSPWGCKESDTTEQLHFHFHFQLSLHRVTLYSPYNYFLN